MFAKQAITQAGNNAITKIPDRRRDDPQQPSQHSPSSAQRDQYATHCGCAYKRFAIAHKYQCVESISNRSIKCLRCRHALEGSEPQFVFRITRQKPIHGVITESADAVEEYGRTISVGRIDRRFV